MKPHELFETTGYAVKYGVFSREEVELIRQNIAHQFKMDTSIELVEMHRANKTPFVSGELLNKDYLRLLLVDPRMLQMARDLLNCDSLVYFGESYYQIGSSKRGFHRTGSIDSSSMVHGSPTGHKIVRLGICLHDFTRFSGGMKIKSGSHKKTTGPSMLIESNPGDVIAWYPKTLIAENAVKLRGMRSLSPGNPLLENAIPAILKVKQVENPMFVCMTFGAKGIDPGNYWKESGSTRQHVPHVKTNTIDEADTKDLLIRSGIEWIQPVMDQSVAVLPEAGK